MELVKLNIYTINEIYLPRGLNNQQKRCVKKGLSVKMVFLKISQNSQENTCARVSFLIKLQAWGLHFF